jgi:hypothetical protein
MKWAKASCLSPANAGGSKNDPPPPNLGLAPQALRFRLLSQADPL